MGLFNMLFKKDPIKQTKGYFKMLDGYTPVYTNYRGGLYEMLQTKAVINTISWHPVERFRRNNSNEIIK